MLISIKHISVIIVASIILTSCTNENKEFINQVKQLENRVDSVESVYNDLDIDELNMIYQKLTKSTEFFKSNFVLFEDEDTSVTKYIYACRNLTKRMNRSFKRGGSDLGNKIKEQQLQLSNLKHDLKHGLLTDTAEINKFIGIEQKAVVNMANSSKTLFSQFKTEKDHYYRIKDSIDVIIERTRHRVY